jgi:hypothetical protein
LFLDCATFFYTFLFFLLIHLLTPVNHVFQPFKHQN